MGKKLCANKPDNDECKDRYEEDKKFCSENKKNLETKRCEKFCEIYPDEDLCNPVDEPVDPKVYCVVPANKTEKICTDFCTAYPEHNLCKKEIIIITKFCSIEENLSTKRCSDFCKFNKEHKICEKKEKKWKSFAKLNQIKIKKNV